MSNEVLTASESERFLTKLVEALVKEVKEDKLWTIKDIAEYTKFHENRVYEFKNDPTFPKHIKLTKQPRWIPEEVKSWIKRRR